MNGSSSTFFDIIFENEDFAVLNKKRGIPTAPLKEGDFSLLTEFLKTRHLLEKVIGKKEVEAGLIHRLDTATSGIVLIAKRQRIYDTLQHMQDLNLIEKEYIAICDCTTSISNNMSIPAKNNSDIAHSFDIKSYFIPFGKGGKKVKAIFNLASSFSKKKVQRQMKKEYTTHIIITEHNNKEVTCTCRLTQGYRHQVRCHLSCLGLPIKGDALYNAQYIEAHKERIAKEVETHSYPLELYAYKISFPPPYLPLSKEREKLSFSLLPQDRRSL